MHIIKCYNYEREQKLKMKKYYEEKHQALNESINNNVEEYYSDTGEITEYNQKMFEQLSNIKKINDMETSLIFDEIIDLYM